MSRRLIYLGLVLCIVATTLTFACAAPAPTPTPKTTVAPAAPAPATTTAPAPKPTAPTTTAAPAPKPTALQPKSGGTFRILGSGLPSENLGYIAVPTPRWNPTLPYPCVERLIIWDNNGLFAPMLATGWQWSADHMSLTLTLQKGVKFHDGTDFNAAGVKYLLDLVKDSARAELKSVASIDVIDDYTVKINEKVLDNLLLVDMATTAGAIVSPAAIKAKGIDYNVTHPVGTGPFKFVSWQRDVSLEYEKNTNYWQKGKPYLDKVQYLFQSNPVTAKASFQAGEGDVLGTLVPADADELSKKGKYNFTSSIGPLVALAPDGGHADSPFANIKVRQAASYAIDVNTMVKSIGYGYMIPVNQPSAPGIYNYNPDVKGYPYDPKKAKELLAAAGYPTGFKTTIYYESDYTDITNACLAVQQNLKDVGIDATLTGTTMGKMTEIMTKGWQNGLVATRATMGLNYSPLNTIRRNFSALGQNYVSVIHLEPVEFQLQQALQEINQDKMVKEMQQLSKMMIDDYCVIIPLYSRVGMWAGYPYVQQAGWIMGGDITQHSGDTWLNK